MHVNVRIEPRWTFDEVRRAALALSREIERRAPTLATSKWWKEERHGVFLDYNQNAKDRTTCSAYSVRPLPDARVSTPLDGTRCRLRPGRLHGAHGAGALRRARRSARGHGRRAGSLEKLLELAARDEASGLGDAPWPPHFRKTEGEAPRVAPVARARSDRRAAKKTPQPSKPRDRAARKSKMPLLIVANSPDKERRARRARALEGRSTREAAELLAVDDVLVDSMRGRSSTWTRIRVNLRHVPEEQRPPQETPDPDDDPTREWRDAQEARREPDSRRLAKAVGTQRDRWRRSPRARAAATTSSCA